MKPNSLAHTRRTRAALGISTSDAASLMGWEHNKWKDLEKHKQITPNHIRALVQAVSAADFSTAKPPELLELRTKLGISAQACDRLLGKTTTWWGNRERGIVTTPRFYLKLLEERFNEQPESHKKAVLLAGMRKIARKHGFSLKQVLDEHQESHITPKVVKIHVVIGNNPFDRTQHITHEYLRSIYCSKLKQAILDSFPEGDIEVSFTTASQFYFQVTADADEARVSEQVRSIHEKLWQLEFSIVSLEDTRLFMSSMGITIDDLYPHFSRLDWEERLNGEVPTYAYQLMHLAASFASREDVLQLRRRHQLPIKDFCNWLVIEPSYWLALEAGKRRISRKSLDGFAYFLENTKDL